LRQTLKDKTEVIASPGPSEAKDWVQFYMFFDLVKVANSINIFASFYMFFDLDIIEEGSN